MARVLILGGGFGGVVAAESLAKQLSPEHQITLISRSREFVFYPGLVRLAFGDCNVEDVLFDLRQAMLDRRVGFLEAEVARIDPHQREAILAHGDLNGSVPYDYLIIALGRRLATERVIGFFEYANHLLDPQSALKFGEAVRNFRQGHVVIGQCPEARQPIPVYEAAYALARLLEKRADRGNTRITIISPSSLSSELHDAQSSAIVNRTLEKYDIEYVPNFPVNRVTSNRIFANDQDINYDLLMLIPPFRGSSVTSYLGINDDSGYINVDRTMKVTGKDGMYAVGDCVNFDGPKLGHMAVKQAEVAAANVALEIKGLEAQAFYNHELMSVIDEGGPDAFYLQKSLWSDTPAIVRQGRFWTWAKRVHQKYWVARHR